MSESGSLRAIAAVIVGLPDKTFSRLGGKMAVVQILQRAAVKLEELDNAKASIAEQRRPTD